MQIFDRNFWKVSIQGSFAPKTPNLEGSNRYLTQSRLQVKGCTAERYCLLQVVVHCKDQRVSDIWSTFFVRRTVAELRGVKFAQFADFGLFFPYKTPKTYLPVTSLQPRGYIVEWCDFSMWSSKVRVVFLQLLVWELGTPKLAQIFAYGKWLYPYRMLLHGASDLDQRCLKTRNSKDGCTFPPNIFTPSPTIPQTPILGPFNVKLL